MKPSRTSVTDCVRNATEYGRKANADLPCTISYLVGYIEKPHPGLSRALHQLLNEATQRYHQISLPVSHQEQLDQVEASVIEEVAEHA